MEPNQELVDWVTGLRRWFHQHPEPGFKETETQRKVIETLTELGIEHRTIAGTGVVADIQGKKDTPCIALRADMDALRITEPETEHNKLYRSQNNGFMHACGHDGHMAMVLGAGRWLHEHQDSLAGKVRLIFQPSEENLPGGAKSIIEQGGLDRVDGIVGIHLLGRAGLGEFRFRPGPFLAHTSDWYLDIRGKAGHHMAPQKCIDPIMIASRFTSTVQNDIKARFAPDQVYVLGFGTINGGTQYNQTPEEVSMSGSFRSFSTETSGVIEQTMRRNLDGLMQQFQNPESGVEPGYELKVVSGYPVLRNHPGFTARTAEVLRESFPKVVDNMELNLGAEDFSYYLEKVPGMFMFLGASNPDKGIFELNHSSRFDIDETALGIGVNAYLSLATDFLSNPNAYTG
jgi:amidohydrolase